MGSAPALTRRRLLVAGGAVAAAGAAAATAAAVLPELDLGGAGEDRSWAPGTCEAPVFGILQAEPEQFEPVRESGVSAVAISVPWSRAEPRRGRMDEEVVEDVRRRLDAAREAGLQVALTPGLQYPPGWVFEAGTAGGRFVDQDGREWHGEVGDDIADGVFDPRVRDAQEDYLLRLGELLRRHEPTGVRLGGLARGELHYPFVDTDGRRDTFWAYGKAAQDRCPVPGFRPGDDDEEDARVFVDWYLEELSGYGRWQVDVAREAFGDDPRLLVLQPSWGLRPGDVEEAVADGLRGETPGERRGTLTEGLDWERQLPLLAQVPGTAVCTTWVDSPDQGDDPGLISPGRFLAGLAAEAGLGAWGENTGGNDADDLDRCVALVDELDLEGLFWMSAADLGEDGNADLDDYREALVRREASTPTPGPSA